MPKDEKGIGIIAQQIKDAAPYTVGTFKAKLNANSESTTELYSFDGGPLFFAMINALKELDQRTRGLSADSSSAKSTGTSQPDSESTDGQASSDRAHHFETSGMGIKAAGGRQMVPICEPVEAGDVLVADLSQPRVFCLARQASDKTVLGIVPAEASATAGKTRTEPEANRPLAPLVTSGVARCKVDAAFGPVHVGDLLVTSPNPGYAMTSVNPGPGAVVGKALEPLASGAGLIKVLVMLR